MHVKLVGVDKGLIIIALIHLFLCEIICVLKLICNSMILLCEVNKYMIVQYYKLYV